MSATSAHLPISVWAVASARLPLLLLGRPFCSPPLCLMRPQSFAEGPRRSQPPCSGPLQRKDLVVQPGFPHLVYLRGHLVLKMQTNSKQLQEKVKSLYRGG